MKRSLRSNAPSFPSFFRAIFGKKGLREQPDRLRRPSIARTGGSGLSARCTARTCNPGTYAVRFIPTARAHTANAAAGTHAWTTRVGKCAATARRARRTRRELAATTSSISTVARRTPHPPIRRTSAIVRATSSQGAMCRSPRAVASVGGTTNILIAQGRGL